VIRPARNLAARDSLPFEDLESKTCGYCSHKAECRIFAPEDVLVEVWETVIANRFGQFGEEMHCPTIPCAKDDMINLFQFSSIFEECCSFICLAVCDDVGDWWTADDVWVLKSKVEEVWMVFSSDHGVKRSFRDISKCVCYIWA
jgi:hypothetical protein